MSNYTYADDGRLHLRYSELLRCTPGQIERLLAERENPEFRYESENMRWGTDRHDMWANEMRRTGLTPEAFGTQLPVSHVEQEFASEILPGVVLHSRPDMVCAGVETIADAKTLVADSLMEGRLRAQFTYTKSRQLPVYAYQLGLHDIRIRHSIYYVEIWNRTMDEILGYETVTKKFRLADMAAVLPWIHQRTAMLAAALEGARQ